MRFECTECEGDVIVGPHALEASPGVARHVDGDTILYETDADHVAQPGDALQHYRVTEVVVYEVWARDEDDACDRITDDGDRDERVVRVDDRYAECVVASTARHAGGCDAGA